MQTEDAEKVTAATDAALQPWVWLAPALLGLLVYAQTATYGFVNWDDSLYITANPRILNSTWQGLLSVLDPGYAYRGQFVEYFPVRDVVYWLIIKIFGPRGEPFHVVNILFHSVTSGFFAIVLAKRFGLTPLSSFFGAMLFAVHPIHVESVAWVSALKDPMFTLCTLAVMWFWMRDDNVKSTALAFAFLLIGLLIKAMIVVVPAQLFLIDVLLRNKKPWPVIKRLLPLCVVTVIFLLHFVAVGRANSVIIPYKGGTFFTGSLTAFWCLFRYVSSFFLPLGLNARYIVEPVVSPIELRALTSLLGLTAVFGASFALRKTLPSFFFGFAFFAVGLSTVLGFVPIPIELADRYQYMPSLGLCFFVAALVDLSLKRPDASRRQVTIALSVCVLVVMSAGTIKRNEIWKDSVTLWRDVLDQPGGDDFLIAKIQLANGLHLRGQRKEAHNIWIDVANRSELERPGVRIARMNLAMTALKAQRPDEATHWLTPYFESGEYSKQEHIFALVALWNDDTPGAEKILASIPSNRPRSARLLTAQAAVLLTKGDDELAMQTIVEAVDKQRALSCAKGPRPRIPPSVRTRLSDEFAKRCAATSAANLESTPTER